MQYRRVRGWVKQENDQVPSNRKTFLRAAELIFALAMRVVPYGYRFSAAVLVARAVVPLMRQAASYREQEVKGFHTPREITLYLLLNALTKNGTAFNPDFIIEGYEQVEDAQAAGKAVLLTGHHAALTLLMVRVVHDSGISPTVITPDVSQRVAGTLVTPRTIQPSAMFLVQLRSSLRRGEVVCAMPDRARHTGDRTVEFATSAGRVIFAPAIIDIAARCGARVLFTEVRLKGRRLTAKVIAPSEDASTRTELADEFMAFVSACAGAEHALR